MRESLLSHGVWWKLLAVSPCLVVLVIVASGLGVNAWFLGLSVVLLAAACAVAGVALGLLTLLHHRPVRR